ncbi:MAG: discoidin domain-containing protein, partial [Planctomycetaceae bacterium]
QGDKVVVSSPKVAGPVAVRYAWADFPLCNLYNREGFPAVPFRTDQFESTASGRTSGEVGGIGVGKPFICNQPILNGRYGGLTDGDLRDNNQTAWASNGEKKFPKHVTVDLQGRYNVTDLRVHNSALGGTRTVEVQVSRDGREFTTLGRTEFRNYSADVFELSDVGAQGVTHVRLVFPDVHEISFRKKASGFVFLRELEVQGTLAQ